MAWAPPGGSDVGTRSGAIDRGSGRCGRRFVDCAALARPARQLWTLHTDLTCESVTFGSRHTFSAVRSNSSADGGGDQGTFAQPTGRHLTLTWTAGPSAGSVFNGTFRKSDNFYTGPATWNGTTASGELNPASVIGCPVVSDTLGAATEPFGESDTDAVTVTGTGGVAPTGWVQIFACPASDSPCDQYAANAQDLGTAYLTGTGDSVTISTSFSPDTLGGYCFADFYGGANRYDSVLDVSPATQCFTVTPASPTVTTAASLSSVVIGSADSDSALVTGSSGKTGPTGTVAFYACGPTLAPTTCTTATGTAIGSPVTLTPGLGPDSPARATSPEIHRRPHRHLLLPGRLFGRRQLQPGLRRLHLRPVLHRHPPSGDSHDGAGQLLCHPRGIGHRHGHGDGHRWSHP